MIVRAPGETRMLGLHVRGVSEEQPILGIRIVKGELIGAAIAEHGLTIDTDKDKNK